MEDYIAEFTQIDKEITYSVRELDNIIFDLDKYNESEDEELLPIIGKIESVKEDLESIRGNVDRICDSLENNTEVNYENVDIKDFIYYLQFSDIKGGLNSLIDELKFFNAIN